MAHRLAGRHQQAQDAAHHHGEAERGKAERRQQERLLVTRDDLLDVCRAGIVADTAIAAVRNGPGQIQPVRRFMRSDIGIIVVG